MLKETDKGESVRYSVMRVQHMEDIRNKSKITKFFNGIIARRFFANNLTKCATALEIGAGLDNLALFLPKHIRVMQSDINPEIVREAKERRPQAEYMVFSADQIPFRDGSFDAIFGNNILHCIYPLDGVAKESYRLLTPQGIVIHTADLLPNTDVLGKWLNANTNRHFEVQVTFEREKEGIRHHIIDFGTPEELAKYEETLQLFKEQKISHAEFVRTVRVPHVLSHHERMEYFFEMLRQAFAPYFNVNFGRVSFYLLHGGFNYMVAQKKPLSEVKLQQE